MYKYASLFLKCDLQFDPDAQNYAKKLGFPLYFKMFYILLHYYDLASFQATPKLLFLYKY